MWSFPPVNGEVPFNRRLTKTTVVSMIGRANVRTADKTLLSGGKTESDDTPFHRNSMLRAAIKAPRNWVPVSPIYILEGCQLKKRKARMAEEVPSMRIKNTVVSDFSIRISEIMVESAARTTIDAIASILSSKFMAFISPITHNMVTI